MTLLASFALALVVSMPLPRLANPGTTIVAPAAIKVATPCGDESIVGASEDRNVYVWSATAGTLAGMIAAGEPISTLACSPDGRWIAAGSDSGVVLLIDARTRGITRRLTVTRRLINVIAFSPDGSLLVLCPDDGPAQLWNVEKGSRSALLQPRLGASVGVAFSADSTRVATADEDTRVRVYDRAGRLVREIDFGLLAPFAVAFTADGTQVLAGGVDRSLTVFDVSSGKVVGRSAEEPDLISQLARLPDGHTFAVLSVDEFTLAPTTLKIWDVRSRQFQSTQKAVDIIGGAVGKDGLIVVVASADRKRLDVRRVP
jgi:WD40 repeat protein